MSVVQTVAWHDCIKVGKEHVSTRVIRLINFLGSLERFFVHFSTYWKGNSEFFSKISCATGSWASFSLDSTWISKNFELSHIYRPWAATKTVTQESIQIDLMALHILAPCTRKHCRSLETYGHSLSLHLIYAEEQRIIRNEFALRTRQETVQKTKTGAYLIWSLQFSTLPAKGMCLWAAKMTMHHLQIGGRSDAEFPHLCPNTCTKSKNTEASGELVLSSAHARRSKMVI